jgi:hypothetical protein
VVEEEAEGKGVAAAAVVVEKDVVVEALVKEELGWRWSWWMKKWVQW